MCGEIWWGQEGVDGNDLLEKGGHNAYVAQISSRQGGLEGSQMRSRMTRTERVPEDKREIVVLLSLLAELEEGTLPCVRVHQVDDQGIYFVLLMDADYMLLVGLETERGGLGIPGKGRASETLLLVWIELGGVLQIRERFWRNEPRHGWTERNPSERSSDGQVQGAWASSPGRLPKT